MSELKQALLNADKSIVTVNGERRKLHCCEVNGHFFCDAEILNPKTPEDAKFCLMDLWKSQSEHAMAFLLAFVEKGSKSEREVA